MKILKNFLYHFFTCFLSVFATGVSFEGIDKFDNFNKNWHSYKFNYGLIYCNKDEEVDFNFIMNFDIDNK